MRKASLKGEEKEKPVSKPRGEGGRFAKNAEPEPEPPRRSVPRRTAAVGADKAPEVDARDAPKNASQDRANVDMSQLSPRKRKELGMVHKPNARGVTYDPKQDTCFHLNIGWKNGCCTDQGNVACPFLGGNQVMCDLFKDREPIRMARKGVRGQAKYRNQGEGK